MSEEQRIVWHEIADLINQLPVEERRRFREAIRRWLHDMGNEIGLVRTSESLIRRMAPNCQCTDMELLNIIRQAGEGMKALLAEAQALGSNIDDGESE